VCISWACVSWACVSWGRASHRRVLWACTSWAHLSSARSSWACTSQAYILGVYLTGIQPMRHASMIVNRTMWGNLVWSLSFLSRRKILQTVTLIHPAFSNNQGIYILGLKLHRLSIQNTDSSHAWLSCHSRRHTAPTPPPSLL